MKSIPKELQTLYPFKNTEKNYLSINGHNMHFMDEGQGDPVVMLHGNPTWSFYYRNLVLSLRDYCRCIVPDHMGCGLSDKPQHYNYILQTHIDNAYALINHLNLGQFHLVVHDWGGAIGMGLALQKCIARVKSIVILNTAAFLSPRIPLRINICKTPILGDVLIRGFNAFLRASFSMATTRGLSNDVEKGYLYPYRNWHDRIAQLRFVQDIPMDSNHPSYKTLLDIEENLIHLRFKPMMIGWGMKDFCFNKYFLETWEKFFLKAKVHRYDYAGHYVLEDAQEEIIPTIRNFIIGNANVDVYKDR